MVAIPLLAAAYWLHMVATVFWIGGLAATAWLVIPTARQTLDAAGYARFLTRLAGQLQRVGWLSLLVLGATGMFQMSANPNYDGFMAIENPWAAAILAKHAAILLMIAVSAYSTWGLMPQLQRAALLRAAGKLGEDEEARLLRRESSLVGWNLVIALFVLALTALARVY